MNNLTSGTKVVGASFELRRGEVHRDRGTYRRRPNGTVAPDRRSPDKPTSGSITLNGQQLTERDNAAIAADIGLAPEERKREESSRNAPW